jgi:hypothetical protein
VQAVSDLRAAVGGGKDAGIVRTDDHNSTDAPVEGTDSNGRQLDWGRVLGESPLFLKIVTTTQLVTRVKYLLLS